MAKPKVGEVKGVDKKAPVGSVRKVPSKERVATVKIASRTKSPTTKEKVSSSKSARSGVKATAKPKAVTAHPSAEVFAKKIAIVERISKRASEEKLEQDGSPKTSRTPRFDTGSLKAGAARHITYVSRSVTTVLGVARSFHEANHDALMERTARFGGTLIVMIGAFLTLYNMNALANLSIGGGANNLAQTSGSITCPAGTTCDAPTQTTITTTGGTTQTTQTDASTETTVSGTSGGTVTYTTPSNIDTKPNADVMVDGTHSALSGSVPVNVTVPYATRVDLLAYNTSTKQLKSIATLPRATDLLWKGSWPTTSFDDGTYRLRVAVTNRYGSYVVSPSDEYTIANHYTLSIVEGTSGTVPGTTNTTNTTNTTDSTTAETTISTKSTTTDTTTTTTTPPDSTTSTTVAPTTTMTTIALPELYVSVPSGAELKGTFDIKVQTSKALSVRHYLKSVNATEWNLIGDGALVSATEWRMRFDTTRFKDGSYELRTIALFDGEVKVTRTSGVTIKNTATLTIPTSTTTTTTIDPLKTAPTTGTTTASLVPAMVMEFTRQSPLRGNVDVYLSVPTATFVEFYVVPEKALTQRFVGLGVKKSDDVWKFSFDTTSVPNGSYQFYASVRHPYGVTKSNNRAIKIDNPLLVEKTPEEVKQIEALRETGEEVEKILYNEVLTTTKEPTRTEVNTTVSTESRPVTMPPLVTPIQPVEVEKLAESLGDAYTEELDALLKSYRSSLDKVMRAFSRALRHGDIEAESRALEEIASIQSDMLAHIPEGDDRDAILAKIQNYTETITKDTKERTERSEALIKERVGEAVKIDSDQDGVTDYDEVNVYKTDPKVADTDKDGFIDGIEILGGYDPRNSAPEANVVYESPKESGVVREDVLTIQSITSVKEAADDEDINPKAHLAGTALPNSFVTIYIFSTPVVVTVKTDNEGNWSYVFDKELEDGDHEVYVAMTDNAGKIVAKSNPLAFVKTAEAFTPVSNEANALNTNPAEEPSLITETALLVVGSIAVVALGLVLILLGLHVRSRTGVVAYA